MTTTPDSSADDSLAALRNRVLEAIRDHRSPVVFHDLDEVPVGSTGYFTPGGRGALRDERGWIHDDRRFDPQSEKKYIFTAQSGPANDARLVDEIVAALAPEHHVLVSFRAEYDRETDWELGHETAWCDLVDAELLGHRFSDDELAHLLFAVEQFGGLQEGDGFSRFSKAIETLGEPAVERLRDREQRKERELRDSWLQRDAENQRKSADPHPEEG